MSDPIELLSGNERITVPAHLLHSNASRGDHYVLRVVGDSLNDEMICDGDYVIVLRRDKAESGEVVVCVTVDEATIKRWYRENDGMIRLQPINPDLEAIRLPENEVRVQGIVVGLIRKM